MAAFAYDPSRSGEAAERLIGTGDGNLCVDGYSGYVESTRDNRTRSGCWAHARRKVVFESRSSAPDADELLDMIRELYKVERDAANDEVLGSAEHLQSRQEQSRPVLGRIDTWIAERQCSTPPKIRWGRR